MKYLPYDDFNIITPLSPAEVEERLQKEIEPPRGFSFTALFFQSSGYYFSGYILNGNFELQQVIRGRNHFTPQITGVTEPGMNGSRIHIKMKMYAAVVVLLCIWIVGTALAAVAGFVAILTRGQSVAAVVVPLGMLLTGYVLPMFGFKPEADEVKARLLKILQGTIEE